MGGRQKSPELLQNKRGGRYKALQPVPPAERPAPPPPANLHPRAEEAWGVLWSSDLAGAFKITDVFGIERYFWYYSEWCKATSLPGDRRFVFACERAMRELEREYGLGPFSRVRLGLTLIDQAKAASGLKADKVA